MTAGPEPSRPVLDGSDVVIPNRWKLAPNTAALVGRPAVWTALDISTPEIPLGFATLPAKRLRWEQDFGGHLFLALTGDDATNVTIVEGGPLVAGGSGNLVPFEYPEDDFARRGVSDFEPVTIPPPNGLSPSFFVRLMREAQHAYDGDQRYLAIEMPFLRVGRDSNSYAVGVLLCCGVDPRAIPKPSKEMRYEWTGYPGAEDPVHRANFGVYLGAPTHLDGGIIEVAYHNDDGSVRLVVVGGEPHGSARLPDGSTARLDELGRIAFSPEDAHAHGLPSRHTGVPEQIRKRRHFPTDPAPQGAQITLVVGGESVPLVPGTEHTGRIVERHDALGLATLRRNDGVEVVLPLAELGVELRDPKRVDKLLHVGTELTVGLHSDRHPKIVVRGDAAMADRFGSHRLHAPRPVEIAGAVALGLGLVAAGGLWFVQRDKP
ncbi:MAG: hypothetical protein IAI49_07840 [Candidatus Eremiobacteraeota bacterium]|nr:hypothetical protein [Candidatus Eremiobacteraeota bacterium]